MPRRYDPTRVLVAQVLGTSERDDRTPADLLDAAEGRRDVLEAALVIARRGSSMRPPVPAVIARIEAALAEVA